MGSCYCLQFNITHNSECDLTYTNCDGDVVTETFYSGVSYSICSQDLIPESPCYEISFFNNGLCVNGECVGSPINVVNECDVLTIFPLGVECSVVNPTDVDTFNGSATLIITGGSSPYQIYWDNGNISQTINGLGIGEYGCTVVDYYGDFTANTICSLTASTPTPTPPVPTPTPIPTYDDLCFVITSIIGGLETTTTLQFNFNDYYEGYPTWISDDTLYNIVWYSGSSQWEVSGWTNGSLVNTNPATPPISGWVSLGSGEYEYITSINVVEGICEDLNVLSYKVSVNQPQCSCNGSIIFDVKDGVPPYSYSIDGGKVYGDSPIFNGLCGGMFSTKVMDSSGQTSNYPVYLNEPVEPTNYTLTLNHNYSNGLFDITISPQLPIGASISFDFVHNKYFDVSPNVGAAYYTNDVTLNVDSVSIPLSVTNGTTGTNLIYCKGGTKTTTNTYNTWNNLTMYVNTIIDGSVSDFVTSVTPNVKCFDYNNNYSLYITNAVINNCDCCGSVMIVNPINSQG